jgi:hypothetical protein
MITAGGLRLVEPTARRAAVLPETPGVETTEFVAREMLCISSMRRLLKKLLRPLFSRWSPSRRSRYVRLPIYY